MKTSQKQISKNGEVKSMFSQEDSPASHSVLPESERERKITAISGAKCYEQYGKFSPLGLLVKTLMDSYRWYSPARRLKWDAQTIYSKRITYTEQNSNSLLMSSVKTLRMQDIQSSRLLFRLVPSEHPTEEIGCGLLPTVQIQGLKVCNREGKTEFVDLSLLPTPTAIDKGSRRINKSLSKGAAERPTLAMAARMRLLPTPKAQEARGNCSVNRNKFNLTDKIAELTSPTSDASQLNPLFVAEMMGYPLEWLTLPFLSQNGEAKALKR